MPVPTLITDLSQTEGSNSPAGSEAPTTADNYFRAHAMFIAMLRDGKGFTDPVTLASATTTDIGGQNAMFVEVSGTTTITSFGTTYNGPRFLRFTGALILTHNATTLNLPGSANITTVAGDTCVVIPNSTPNGWNVVHYQRKALAPGAADSGAVTSATTATNIAGGALGSIPYQTASGATSLLAAGSQGQAVVSGGAAAPVYAIPVLRGYIDGLTLSTAGSSTTMSIAAGVGADSSNVYVMNLAASISKTTGSWAVGTAQGGLDTGVIANSTWYYFFLIRRPDTGVVDVVFSATSASPTLPTNYTQYRYIGAGLTNGSAQWTKFLQTGDEFFWDVAVEDLNSTVTGPTNLTCSIPRGRKMRGYFTLNFPSTTGSSVYISDPDRSDQAVASPSISMAFASNALVISPCTIFTNTSAQIRYRCAAATNLIISTQGWMDLRGKA